MTPTTAGAYELKNEATARDRVIDACCRFAHVPQEPRRLKSFVADAVDDGFHRPRRAIRSASRRVRQLVDLKDDAVRRVKGQPLEALTTAVGVGVVLGLVIGVISGDSRRRQ